VNSRQIIAAVRALLFGVTPIEEHDKVCLDCKRHNTVCVMVTKGEPCMGPVTRTGCGALCPDFGRACYACYGPAENINTYAFAGRLSGLGLVDEEVARRFLFINSGADAFQREGVEWGDVS
jgi:coenzyme F420-reducing hydrogenase gamma subunit